MLTFQPECCPVERGELRLYGLFTHLSHADDPAHPSLDMQRDRLTAAADKLDKIGIRPHVLHAANSAAVLTRPDTYFT